MIKEVKTNSKNCCKKRLYKLKSKYYKITCFVCNVCDKIHTKEDVERLLK